MKINRNYLTLEKSYLFARIANRVKEYSAENPDCEIIRLGIGDVTRPLCAASVEAMQKACAEMGTGEGFHGYCDSNGYLFLREAICGYYEKKGVKLSDSEVFVSDGVKGELGSILDIFDADNTVLIPDPVYPVYVDTNKMHGRKVIFADANENNGFLPMPAELNGAKADIIYLCSPNNPTGAVYEKAQLAEWVKYALEMNAVILFDAAYEAFVADDKYASSIYQVENAKKCAIEFCSLSKTAGFTGTRCGYTVIPSELVIDSVSLQSVWSRDRDTKFNGTAYIIQRGAQAIFSEEGFAQCKSNIDYYLNNARIIRENLEKLGLTCFGGENSPYVWARCPDNMLSWEYFELLLTKYNIVTTPGAGFGKNGEGFIRLTSFNTLEKTEQAMSRLFSR